MQGYKWDEGDTRVKWLTAIRRARYNLFDGELLALHGWSFRDSPRKREIGPDATSFGNCAETYPFIHLMR